MGWIKDLLIQNKQTVQTNNETDLPEVLPVLPLKDAILMPESILPLIVSNPSSAELIREFHEKDRYLLATGMEKPEDIHLATWENLYKTGCVAKITKITENESNELSIIVKGIKKATLEEKISDTPLIHARVKYVNEDLAIDRHAYAMAHSVREVLNKLARLSYHNMESILVNLTRIKDPLILFSTTATTLPVPASKKQAMLQKNKLVDKYDVLYKALKEELSILELSSKISETTKGEINNAQREYYLRQQLKTIKKELGEESDDEIAELRSELEAKDLPEEVMEEVEKDIKRIARMQPGSSEYVTIRTYLDWILDLPWKKQSEDNLDILAAEKVLDEDHFDLKKPKKRIIEFLSVKKLKGEIRGPILCFVGPPGVGKTSLGKSIAKSMDRKFVRISLGGVRDEAEIRGHRRTYIGAMPGRIINGIKQAQSSNPVFMLDEIDKLTQDIHGDPSSALLEALDPEQNSNFVDHYLNVPYDLSKVFFITTANVIDDIPIALRDRLEIVEIEGYTQEDKLQIAKKYLLPKEIDANGLADTSLDFSDEAITRITRHYTRESGVRSLQRKIASILRYIAAEVARNGDSGFKIDNDFVEKALGPIRFVPETTKRTSIPGVATGLAWTPFGGEILFIETALIDNKEEMILTGQMGDVMKESARIALSLVKNTGQTIPEGKGLHIHVPAGAIPKDGPSAGITLVTSIVSLLTGRVIKEGLAMTGEITLRGVVLPVGGVKEKVLAARRLGIREIILPAMNEKDLLEIEGDAMNDMTIHPVENIDEVLNLAFPDMKEDMIPVVPAAGSNREKTSSPAS